MFISFLSDNQESSIISFNRRICTKKIKDHLYIITYTAVANDYNEFKIAIYMMDL